MSFNSRNIRISKITNAAKEKKNMCDVAEGFAHNLSTSERYYNKNIDRSKIIDLVEDAVPGPSGLCKKNQSYNSGECNLRMVQEHTKYNHKE